MRAAILFALVLASSQAHADTTPRKSPAATTAIAIGATVLPFVAGLAIAQPSDEVGGGLILASLVVGPSVGHWYAGEARYVGLAARAVGIGTGILALSSGCIFNDGTTGSCRGPQYALVASALVLAGGVVFDWVTAGASARRHDARASSVAGVAPMIGRDHAGISLGASF